MTERDRLIEILDQEQSRYSEDIADHLLDNGGIVPHSSLVRMRKRH